MEGQGCGCGGVTTSLAPIEQSQLMDTLPRPSSTSPVVPAKLTGHSKYCPICMPLGKICLEEFAMSSDWDDDDDDEDHAKTEIKTIIRTRPKPVPIFYSDDYHPEATQALY